MVDAAKNLLSSLSPEQRKRAVFTLDNMNERTHWLYTPFQRNGLPLREMTSAAAACRSAARQVSRRRVW